MTDAVDPTLPPLSTRVGHAGHGDNRFCGHSVHDELTGTLPYWSLIALSVGRGPLSATDCAILDALSVAGCAADPRIWPLKAVRLGSAHGSATLGICAGMLVTDGVHGPRNSTWAAEVFTSVREAAGDDPDDATLERVLEPHFAVRVRPIPGFGVAARSEDERVIAFDDWRRREGHELGPYWRIMRRIEAIAVRRRRTPVNLSGAVAAVLLDVGFTPAQVHVPAMFTVMQNFVANAAEGAEQAPAVLRELPARVVTYVGKPPRTSPRAGG